MNKANLAKIAISVEADKALEGLLEKVNLDNNACRITKAQLASWVMLQTTNFSSNMISDIQAAHFDQIYYLENLLRTIKRDGRESLTQNELEILNPTKKRRLVQKSDMT